MMRLLRASVAVFFLCVAPASRATAQQADASVADSLMTAKDFAGASKVYERLVAQSPKEFALWRGLAFASYQTKNYSRAAEAFEHVAELTSAAQPLFNAGVAHALAGHDDAAFVYLNKAAATGKVPLDRFRSDADLERLRKDKRFDEVIAAAQKAASQ